MRARGRRGGGGAEGGRVRSQRLCSEEEREREREYTGRKEKASLNERASVL